MFLFYITDYTQLTQNSSFILRIISEGRNQFSSSHLSSSRRSNSHTLSSHLLGADNSKLTAHLSSFILRSFSEKGTHLSSPRCSHAQRPSCPIGLSLTCSPHANRENQTAIRELCFQILFQCHLMPGLNQEYL